MTETISPQPPAPASTPASLPQQLSAFAGDIKLHHTVFALPFALLSMILAARGLPPAGIIGLILVCMVTARTLAMAVNRLLDAKIDAENPRTVRRAIPAGTLSRRFYWTASALCTLTFIAATAGFYFAFHNPWPLALSIPVLAFLSAYPLLKRFTRLCHYWLGAALALAPICAWIAVRGTIALPPLIMAAAVLCWTAGFDIIYACQDFETDVRQGLFSVPSKIGIGKALIVARLTHAVAASALIALGFASIDFGWIYFTGVGLAITLLVIEHSLVSEKNLSKIGLAFFTLNGVLSLVLSTLGIIDVFRHHHHTM